VPRPDAHGFEQQTLRLLVHPTRGGEAVRIRVCNTFGKQPVEIGEAAIALEAAGAATVRGSAKPIHFAGRASSTVAPGQSVMSDPVSFSFEPDRMLAVSLFLPSSTGPATVHPLATQTSYVSGHGNFVSETSGESFATKISVWPLVCGLEVRAKGQPPVIVAFGDSITDGARSTPDTNRRWPDVFAARLQEAGFGVAVVNAGISGNRLLHDAINERIEFGPQGLGRFERDVLNVAGVTHVVVLIGINDIGQATPARNSGEMVSAEEIIAGLRQLTQKAHARGLKIIGATLTPIGVGGVYDSELNEAKRQAVNEWLRSSHDFDHVIDFDAATRDPSNPKRFRPAYDSGDHLHPNDAGYRAMAESIDLTIFD
jgi:lysophospholipase L1-like esterase